MLTIPIAKAGQSVNVDLSKLIMSPEASDQFESILVQSPKLAYVLAYGLTQSLNDAHAALTAKGGAGANEIMALVEKKLAAIYDGSVRVKGTATKGLSPVMREAMKLAQKWWKALGVAKQNATIGKVRSSKDEYTDLDDDAITAKILHSYAMLPAQQEKAKAFVALNAKPAGEDVDLDALGFGAEESTSE